jgi:hypothetical protein
VGHPDVRWSIVASYYLHTLFIVVVVVDVDVA